MLWTGHAASGETKSKTMCVPSSSDPITDVRLSSSNDLDTWCFWRAAIYMATTNCEVVLARDVNGEGGTLLGRSGSGSWWLGANASSTQSWPYDAVSCSAAPTAAVPITLTGWTATAYNGTSVDAEVSVQFFVYGQWSVSMLWFTGGVTAGETKSNTYMLAGRPTMVRASSALPPPSSSLRCARGLSGLHTVSARSPSDGNGYHFAPGWVSPPLDPLPPSLAGRAQLIPGAGGKWISQVRLSCAATMDAWSFWKVALTVDGCDVVLRVNPGGVYTPAHPDVVTADNDSWEPYWMGLQSPAIQTFVNIDYDVCLADLALGPLKGMLRVYTSRAEHARSLEGDKLASFWLPTRRVWTTPVVIGTSANYGEVLTYVAEWTETPTQVRLSVAPAMNNWGIWKVELLCGGPGTILEDPAGETGTHHPAYDPDAVNWEPYWVGDMANSSMVLDYDYFSFITFSPTLAPKPWNSTYVELSAWTSMARDADSTFGNKWVRFMVFDEWTPQLPLFTTCTLGQNVRGSYVLDSYPTYVMIGADEGSDTWGYWKLTLDTGYGAIVLLEDPNGKKGTLHGVYSLTTHAPLRVP